MMQPARCFQDLVVWQKAHELVLEVTYGLTSQLRRSAISVPANIAEGFKKRGRNDKARFFNIAQGSLEETRYYLILAEDLDYGTGDLAQENVVAVSKLLEAYLAMLLNSGSGIQDSGVK